MSESNASGRSRTPVFDKLSIAKESHINHALLPQIDPAQALLIMEQAHKTCSYSKAIRGDTAVELVVDSL